LIKAPSASAGQLNKKERKILRRLNIKKDFPPSNSPKRV
jgi:hypothetical protein